MKKRLIVAITGACGTICQPKGMTICVPTLMGRGTNLVCSTIGLFAGNTSGNDRRDDRVDDDFATTLPEL